MNIFLRHPFFNGFSSFWFLILVAGCSTTSLPAKKGVTFSVVQDVRPTNLRVQPEINYQDISDYKSRSVTKVHSNGQIVRKLIEAVDFSVETKVLAIDKKTGLTTYKVSTIEKDGAQDLTDFAMPELGESLEYTIKPSGEIVNVRGVLPGTIYYLPPVSLPKEAVNVGDTWAMKAEWVSAKSGIPLQIDMVSILKNWRNCKSAGLCAEIEVSGGVSIKGLLNNPLAAKTPNEEEIKLRFISNFTGKILLSVKNGIVLYSVTRSNENLMGQKDHVEVSSCVVTYVKKPEESKLVENDKVECDPVGDLPTF